MARDLLLTRWGLDPQNRMRWAGSTLVKLEICPCSTAVDVVD